MGVFDFVKSGVREMMIARPDSAQHLICYKHPDQNIPMYSQLTVRDGEAAVFYKDGVVVGYAIPPGRHTLQSQNIPFLNSIVTKFTGGDVFIAELFFVKTYPLLGVPFGGPLESMEDPILFEFVTPRIFGEFAVQIVQPAVFIASVYRAAQGQHDNDTMLNWIKGKFFMAVKTVIAQTCTQQQKSMLNLGGLSMELAERIKQHSPHLEEIGVRITDIGNFNINLTDEDKALLRDANKERGAARRGVGIAADQAQAKQFELDQKFNQDARYVQNLAGNWQNYAAGQAIMGAGQGMAAHGVGGGIAGLGAEVAIGASVGGAMAGAFQNQPQFSVGQPQQAPQQPPQPVAAPGGGGAPGMLTCGKCGAHQPQGKFCGECGSPLAPAKKFCTNCSQELVPPTVKFCANCGTSTTGTVPGIPG